MDTGVLGRLTGEMMEVIDEHHDSEEATLRTVLIVCEVDYPDGGNFVMRCSDDRPWVMEAFLHEARESVVKTRLLYEEAANELDEDED